MKTYKIVLTDKGKDIFKGGNIEVMQPVLNYSFAAKDTNTAEAMLHRFLLSNGGSSQKDYYTVEEAKQ